MKLRDIIHISSKNIRVYRKKNLIVIAAMGIIFGLIFIINLWLQGLENNYRNFANNNTGGKIIITARNANEVVMVGTTAKPKLERGEIIKDIEANGGKIIQDGARYGIYGSIIIPQNLIPNAIEADIDKAPDDAAPTLISVSLGEQLLGKTSPIQYTNAPEKQYDYEQLRSELIGKTFTDRYGAKYYIAGMSTGGFNINNLSFRQLDRKNGSLLNPILEKINIMDATPLVIDNGKRGSWQSGDTTMLDGLDESIVAVFDNNSSAYRYFKEGKGAFSAVDLPNKEYRAETIAGMSPEIDYIFHVMNFIALIISIILAGVAAIVVIFTSIRLVDQDRQNIALYYSLGATKKQIKSIYLCYFLELMMGTLIFAYGLATLITILWSNNNQELLSVQSELAFSLPNQPSILWYGTNITTFAIMGFMLAMAGICVLINSKRMSEASLESLQ